MQTPSAGFATTAIQLLQHLTQNPSCVALQDGGLFVSPVSIVYALAMTLNGAGPGSPTHSQLWSLLRACHPGGEDHLNQLLNHLMVRLTTLPPPAQSWGGPARPPPQAEVCIANGIFLRQAVLHQAYVTKMRQLLQSSVQQVSSYQEVNDWVREQTRGKIQGVLSENFIGAVLANAVYFKGKWLQPFKKELTAPAPFASPSGPIMVNMMRADLKGVLHARVPGVLDAVCLPYEGGEYRAVLLLPARPGISLDETLTCFYSDAKQMSAARHSTVDLSLPRFKVEATIKLKEVMQGLGVTAPFTLGQADFSRMGPGTFFVEDAVHKAIVEVDEEGTVAAAVTAVTCFFGAAASPDPHVRLVFDRPFVHIIEHMATQLPLFVGKVLHPSQGEQPASRSDRKQGWPQQQGQPGQQGWPQQQGQQGWPQQLGQQGQHHPVYTGPFSHITAPATAPAASFLPNTAGPQASPAGVGQHGVMNQQREQGLQLVNAAGCPVRLGCASGQHDGSRTFYCGRWLGPDALPGSDGRCGPHDGPACRDCAAFLPRNADGHVARYGAGGCSHLLYCGQYVGVHTLPGSDGYCGPGDGPQCRACRQLQLHASGGYLRNCDGVPVQLGGEEPQTQGRRFFCGRPGPDAAGLQPGTACSKEPTGPKCVACQAYVPRNVEGDVVVMGMSPVAGRKLVVCGQGQQGQICSLQSGVQCAACITFQLDSQR